MQGQCVYLDYETFFRYAALHFEETLSNRNDLIEGGEKEYFVCQAEF